MKSIKITYIILLFILTSCAEDWLDIKNDKQLVVPSTLQDLQALLDNTEVMNFSSTPALGVICNTDYYLTDQEWQTLANPTYRNGYIWAEDIYQGETCYSWNFPYEVILYANLALEGLNKINPSDASQSEWNQIKGQALFYRSWTFFQLAQVFCKPYNANTAATDLGIPLKLHSDISITTTRSTVQQTYDQILHDLQQSLPLLPESPDIATRPGKAAAHALLAKTHLQMSNYQLALNEAEECLKIKNELIDYNTLDSTANYPFERMNSEVIYQSTMAPTYALLSAGQVDSTLFQSYQTDDLRRVMYFRNEENRINFKGTYDASTRQFSGIAVDEVILIKAECLARLNQPSEAINSLNQLLAKRWKSNKFIPYHTAEVNQALNVILEERHKSLIFRGIRWMDLRRLGSDPNRAVTLTRQLEDKTYTLPPLHSRYTLPIPDEVIEISGIQQNVR
ncbi:RagB/SusD family nutrient uptake outer membrane protein [Marinoscillum pacificum]|uniref:RagB/SusD family nutrient uptake outer membrane protein n=1 Tax=Marinoscillum pacificum TaxID=392723 RepID=UPI002158640B|nr:RagB/SusD family nutrient uptake outer membrane protein [Marinoscillum pacificum]